MQKKRLRHGSQQVSALENDLKPRKIKMKINVGAVLDSDDKQRS